MMLTPTDLSKILKVSSAHVTHLAKNYITDDEDITRVGKRAFFNPTLTKQILQSRGVNFNKKEVVAFCNNKGGVGKTSVAVNTALRLSGMGFKVLLVDADSQANATSFLLEDSVSTPEFNLVHVVNEKATIDETIVEISETLHLIPSSLKNSKIDIEVTSRAGSENPHSYFSNMLKDLNYNYIIWDVSPTITTANNWMMLSCTKLVIVTDLTKYGIDGVDITWDNVGTLKRSFKEYNPETKVLINRFDERNKTLLHQISRINEIVGPHHIFNSMFKNDTNVPKSQISRTLLPHNSQAFQDLSEFIVEFCDLNNVVKQ